MSLDPTAREANVKDSIKKFFVDNVERSQSVPVSFDKTLSSPKVQGIEVDKWITIVFGDMFPSDVSACDLTIFCCSKKDAEGFKLSQTRDKVIGALYDADFKIPFYQSKPVGQAWVKLGGMVAQIDSQSAEMEADDGTKFKTISVRVKWGTVL